MDVKTAQFLEDLKSKGFDVAILESQINSNPVLEKQAQNIIGGGILRQQEFSQYMTKTREEKAVLEKQVKELAALHDSAGALEGNTEIYKAALEVIAEQEDLLIKAGFDEEEVKQLSFAKKKGLTDLVTNIPSPKIEPVIITKENENMANEVDTSKFIDIDTFQTASANNIYGSAALSARINAALRRADKLKIEVKDETINNLAEILRKGVEAGKNIDTVFDETFGFTVTEKLQQEEAQKKAVEDARALGRSEGLKEAGIPVRRVTHVGPPSPLSNLFESRKVVVEEKKTTPGEVIRNAKGEVDYAAMRGSREQRRAARLENAENFHDQVLERESASRVSVE